MEKAGRLTIGAQKRTGHKDKRNLYLADEGLVLEDSAAAEGAAKSDLEKRVEARRDKKNKVKNPIFFVSPTRLSVRNLARHVTDGKLKAMAAAAARAGIEAGRANPQDVRLYLEAQVGARKLCRTKRTTIAPLQTCRTSYFCACIVCAQAGLFFVSKKKTMCGVAMFGLARVQSREEKIMLPGRKSVTRL